MDTLINIGAMFLVALLALVISFIAVRLADRLLYPDLPFGKALGEHNIAVAIFLGALVLGVFMLMGRATAAPLDRYDDTFREHARLQFGYAYDWEVFKAQGMTESNLDPGVCSHVGACGLMQFMPGTAVAMGLQNPFDARASIREGIRYDRQLWRQWAAPRPPWDRLAFALASYNAGLGNVLVFQRRALVAGAPDANLWRHVAPYAWDEPRQYVERIIRWTRRFGGRAGHPGEG